MSTDAFRAHVLSQIEGSVALLVEQNYLSRSNAESILSLLQVGSTDSSTNGNLPSRVVPPLPIRRVTEPLRARAPVPGAVALPSMTSMPDALASPRRPVPPVPAPRQTFPSGVVYARALWSYNERNEDPNDLTFSQGDIIEITEETNPDWWTGRFQGREGIFPSNYVEKLPNDEQTVPAYTPSANGQVQVSEKKPIVGPARGTYKPFGAAYHGRDAPPPSGSGAVNSVGLQEASGQDKKKSKFGKLGNTMANSAAGGVGFGAGAAIGGGIVRAIF